MHEQRQSPTEHRWEVPPTLFREEKDVVAGMCMCLLVSYWHSQNHVHGALLFWEGSQSTTRASARRLAVGVPVHAQGVGWG